ncbi:MAG: serine hydrolase, partial [Flavitalea sp.]
LMNAAITQHITPGAVVLMIRNGEVILDRAYGKHTYQESGITRVTDIFDMASVTKVTATTPVIMKLFEQGKLALDSPVSKYVEVLKRVPGKTDQTIREALLHEAGYYPYIKFYEKLTPLDLSFQQSDSFPLAIAKGYYLRKNYFEDVMWPTTLQSSVPSRGKFVYSDISMYMMKAVAENIMHTPLDVFVQDAFYKPLGMRSSGFRPLERFSESRIVPTTENDNWLRNMRVTGYVNDPGAAMSGGVQGHAGLFANSNDLAIYYQMLLNGGTYGGRKYFEKSTVDLFTARQSRVSTRAYGFAKATEDIMDQPGQPSASAYGHSGYTGTYVWVDPKYQIVYVCLTNRVYPDDGKTYGPAKFNLRALLLEAFYRACM